MTKKEYAKSLHSYSEALTVKEAAEILRVCTKTIYKIINSGELPAVKVGREMRIAKSNIIDYLRQGNCKKSNPVMLITPKLRVIAGLPRRIVILFGLPTADIF